MIENGLKIYARREPWNDGIGIHLVQHRGDGMKFAASLIQFDKLEPGQAVDEPPLRLRQEEAQRLMDELWNCGIRPSEGTGSAGALAATQRHLEDMRKLVFEVPRQFVVPPGSVQI